MSAGEPAAERDGSLTEQNMAVPGQPLPGAGLGVRPERAKDRPGHREPHAHASEQPFTYPLEREWAEPEWTRLPGFRDVTAEQWESAQWQRAHSIKNLKEL